MAWPEYQASNNARPGIADEVLDLLPPRRLAPFSLSLLPSSI